MNIQPNGDARGDQMVMRATDFSAVHQADAAGSQAFIQPDNWPECFDLAAADASPERMRDIAGAGFDAVNPKPTGQLEIKALEEESERCRRRTNSLERSHRGTEKFRTMRSSESVAPRNWIDIAAGCATALVAIGTLGALPVVAGAGIYQSYMIDWVIEDKLWGLAYGLAPLGGVAAAHGLLHSLATDRARERFTRAIYLGAIAAFAYWAWTFGSTFLADPAAGFDAMASASASLSDWYFGHLALEFFGGAAAYFGAMSLLTRNARTVSEPNSKVALIDKAIEAETAKLLACEAARDRRIDAAARHAAAREGYQNMTEVRVEIARKLIAAEAASGTLEALQKLRNAFPQHPKGSDDA